MKLYHCTTDKKLLKYKQTGFIISPVRGWKYLQSAINWNKKTGRNIILEIECKESFPLPDHKPLYHSFWTPENIYKFEVVRL